MDEMRTAGLRGLVMVVGAIGDAERTQYTIRCSTGTVTRLGHSADTLDGGNDTHVHDSATAGVGFGWVVCKRVVGSARSLRRLVRERAADGPGTGSEWGVCEGWCVRECRCATVLGRVGGR